MRTLIFLALLSTNLLAFPQSSGQESPARENLSEVINSEISESRPFISGDGKTLFFCRRYDEANVGGAKDFMDVYVSNQRADGTWEEPHNLGSPVNTRKVNAIAAMGQNTTNLYVINTFNFRNIPVYVAKPEGDSWGELEPVEVDNYYNKSKLVDIHVNEQHGVMLMAVVRDDSRGSQDLYVSFRKTGNSWTEPQNLGNRINTRQDDFAPFLSSDGRTIFFSSYGHRGSGADIYAARRLDDSWEKWTKPVNLGETVNTNGEEVYFSITDDYEYIYLESFTESTTNRDIIRTKLPDEVKPPAGEIDPLIMASRTLEGDSLLTSMTLANVRNVDLSGVPTPIGQYNGDSGDAMADSGDMPTNTANEGDVVDVITEDLVASSTDGNEEEMSPGFAVTDDTNTSEGGDEFDLSSDNSENSFALDGRNDIDSTNPTRPSDTEENPSYNGGSDVGSTPANSNDSNEEVAANTLENQDTPDEYNEAFNNGNTPEFDPKVIRVEEANGTLRVRYLRNIYFAVGETTVPKSGKVHLDRVYELMQQDPTLVLTLSGHSDITGSEKTNVMLSIQRAKAVAKYMEQKGISPDRIEVNGFGTEAPIASNDDEAEGREFNRRVEILMERKE